MLNIDQLGKGWPKSRAHARSLEGTLTVVSPTILILVPLAARTDCCEGLRSRGWTYFLSRRLVPDPVSKSIITLRPRIFTFMRALDKLVIAQAAIAWSSARCRSSRASSNSCCSDISSLSAPFFQLCRLKLQFLPRRGFVDRQPVGGNCPLNCIGGGGKLGQYT